MDLQKLLQRSGTPENLNTVRIGLEREGQRVTPDGRLAATDLPTALVERAPGIQRDFAETQIELVTGVATTTSAALAQLTALHRTVHQTLAGRELIWPLSMPPELPADSADIPIAKLADPQAVAYREHLARAYGRRRQMVSGVHVNFGFSPELLHRMFDRQRDHATFTEFKNAVYLHVAQNYLRYQWLMTYLNGCTPTSWPGLFTTAPYPPEPVRSLRNSHYGYANDPSVQVSYASLDRYQADLDELVRRGRLSSAKEFYGHLRLRGGQTVADVGHAGIEYLELRDLDLDPFALAGVTADQLELIHWFLVLMLWLPVGTDSDAWCAVGAKRVEQTALEAPGERSAYWAEGRALITQLTALLSRLGLPSTRPWLQSATRQLADPTQTLAAQWVKQTTATDPTSSAVRLARAAASAVLA